MKLVIERELPRLTLEDVAPEYAVYLERTNNVRDIFPVAIFATESEARSYCELRQQGKRIAEYEL